ncbi:MAG: AraC-like DNA-binding protein/copper chaperone CopZ [Bacteroidia bacterium]|jgi:AraC-like DNA-binding protein/copper chaperone CopZ
METSEFFVRGMICSSCLKLLTTEMNAIGAEVLDIQLGKITIRYNPNLVSQELIKSKVEANEFEIITDPKLILAETTRCWIINYVWNDFKEEKISDFLPNKIKRPYYLLSRNFTKTFNMSIKNYEQKLKIERTKEKIELEDMSFSEIAYDLGYDNLSSLSRLFKNHTGMSLAEYKNSRGKNRIPIDKIG